MAAYPWCVPWMMRLGKNLNDFRNMKRCVENHADPSGGPAPRLESERLYQSKRQNIDPDVRKILFGQSARNNAPEQ
jgi:hypothetical protein